MDGPPSRHGLNAVASKVRHRLPRGCLCVAGRALGSLCLILAAGCGSSPDLPDRAKVHGTVTLDGTPLNTGTVVFEPDGSKGAKGPPAFGQIDAKGHYELTTDRASPGDGAVIGHHKVRVQARQDVEPGKLAPTLIPSHYENTGRSGLTAEVKPGMVNEIDLPLKSRP